MNERPGSAGVSYNIKQEQILPDRIHYRYKKMRTANLRQAAGEAWCEGGASGYALRANPTYVG